MSIADELREVTNNHTNEELYAVVEADTLLDMANRIDEEHEKAMSEQYKSLTIDMQPMTDENMAKSGWVRLPMDADGVPIHVGDKLDSNNRTITVHKMLVDKYGWVLWDNEGITWYYTSEFTHHKLTVEDLLQEFSDKVCNSGHQWGLDAAETIAEYADRIKEAMEHE